jgi:hypothetical protein
MLWWHEISAERIIGGKVAPMTDETRPVALTAQFTAKARASESQRTDALNNATLTSP